MLRSLAVIAVLAAPGTGWAEENGPLDLQVHAFVSPGFILTSARVNSLARSRDGSFEFAEAGINFTKPLSEQLRVGLQLFTRDLGPSGNYTPQVDWFYLDYRFLDWLGLRAGRGKLPFGLYNETSDVDAARVPILLPQSLYPAEGRNFLLAQTGGEIYGYLQLGGMGLGEYRLYGGTIFIDPSNFSVPIRDLTSNIF